MHEKKRGEGSPAESREIYNFAIFIELTIQTILKNKNIKLELLILFKNYSAYEYVCHCEQSEAIFVY